MRPEGHKIVGVTLNIRAFLLLFTVTFSFLTLVVFLFPRATTKKLHDIAANRAPWNLIACQVKFRRGRNYSSSFWHRNHNLTIQSSTLAVW